MKNSRRHWTFVGICIALNSGCGTSYTSPACRSTCDKIYGSTACDIQRPGRTTEELLNDCQDTCMNAFATPGEIGSYNPQQQSTSSQTPVLENEEQAEAWVECVEITGCEDLTKGYCEPIW